MRVTFDRGVGPEHERGIMHSVYRLDETLLKAKGNV